jgi:hypothetical protein
MSAPERGEPFNNGPLKSHPVPRRLKCSKQQAHGVRKLKTEASAGRGGNGQQNRVCGPEPEHS